MIIDKIERINYTRSSGRQWPGLDRAVLQKIQLLDTHVHTFESLKYHKSSKGTPNLDIVIIMNFLVNSPL